jgi:2-phospho-L-lactate transferase/gluconeogenesis factor (CofD/UPF0052 family)
VPSFVNSIIEHCITPRVRGALYKILESRPNLSAEAALAMDNADAIVYAPSSLHSSILPTLMFRGMPRSITRSRASKVLVMPLVAEGDLTGFTGEEVIVSVLRVLGSNVPSNYIHLVIADIHENSQSIRINEKNIREFGIKLVREKVRDFSNSRIHDPGSLGSMIVHYVNAEHDHLDHSVLFTDADATKV